MKEAAGELNMTVVVVTGIAILVAFFYTQIWPMFKKNVAVNTGCADAICIPNTVNQNEGTITCEYYDEDGNVEAELVCPWKG